MPQRFEDLAQPERAAIWEAMNSGAFYLFTGSGVSLDSSGPDGFMRSASRLTEDLQTITELSRASSLQQNYRLLSGRDIDENLTKPYTCVEAGATIDLLANTRWRRIYTLNIDNCFECSVRQSMVTQHLPPSILSVYNYDDLYSDPSPDEIHSIVHLHGSVEQSERGYVFSHTEYAREMSRQNSWMATLTQLMKAEPFIVAGTSLEEIDVEFYLQQHVGRSPNDPSRAPSVLIEPFPNRLTERACSDHNLVLFTGTVEEFYNRLAQEFPGLDNAYADYAPAKSILPTIDPQTQILFESAFEAVPKKAEPSKRASRFLFGAPLTWEMIAADADIARQLSSTIERDLDRALKAGSFGTIYLSEPGSGKSALLKRTAFRTAKKFQHVFFFTGFETIPEEDAAAVFDKLPGDVVIFIDNVADCISYLVGLLSCLTKRNIVFIGFERIYRQPYLVDALAEYDLDLTPLGLELSRSEGRRLLEKNEEFGFSDVSKKREDDKERAIRSVTSEPISVANCRIQKNFISFDALIQDLIKDTSDSELKLFVLASLARHSYAGGVSKAVLHSIPGRSTFAEVDNVFTRLPVVMAPNAPGYIIPARAAVSERVLQVLKRKRPEMLVDCLVEMANNLAPRVNRKTISARSPESKLSGGLMDFDRTIQRFIDPLAESFYSRIEEGWGWNSRYWEQLSLLKLSRFLEDQSDPFLLQEAIQHARYAYSIDEHPLSLTTLAKTLFAALEGSHGDRDTIFAEGWNLIFKAIQIEKSWTRVKPTAFIVAFKGAVAFARAGGQLSGDQADEAREALAITHQRRLNDRKLNELRDEVRGLVQKS